MPKLLRILFSVLIAISIVSCGSAPQATEPPVVNGNPTSALPGVDVPTQSAPLSNPTPQAAEPSGLKVAFLLNGNIWFWSETTSALQLTSEGNAGMLKISDDGKVIAYTRDQGLWAINSDGTNPRELVADIAAYAGRRFLTQIEFQPGTHLVYFSTRESVQGTVGDDLHRVDADSPAPQTLLQKGGRFTFSPDGKLLALADINRINILRTDTPTLLSALDFQQVNTNADWSYYPQVVWLNNSTGFYTVIPGNNGGKARFLYVSADGSFSAQLAEFIPADIRVSQPIIAPNGSKVAYITVTGDAFNVHIIDASTADAVIATHPTSPQFGLWNWSPDSSRLTYWATNPALPLLVGINLPASPLVDSLTANSLTWIDANRFLYITSEGQLRLGTMGNPNLAAIASGFTFGQDARYYDFAP